MTDPSQLSKPETDGPLSEADVLEAIGGWRVGCKIAVENSQQIARFDGAGFLSIRRHYAPATPEGDSAYELTTQGLRRLALIGTPEQFGDAVNKRDWYRANTSIPAQQQSSDDGVEVRHATTGNKAGSIPEEAGYPSATRFVREEVRGSAIQTCAGVTPGSSEALSPHNSAPVCRNCGDENKDFPASEFCGMCREMGCEDRPAPEASDAREAVARMLVPYWLGGFERQERNERGHWEYPPYTPNARAYEIADKALAIIAARHSQEAPAPQDTPAQTTSSGLRDRGERKTILMYEDALGRIITEDREEHTNADGPCAKIAREAIAKSAAVPPQESADLLEEAAGLIWAELCPGMVMGADDSFHYRNAARAVLALLRSQEVTTVSREAELTAALDEAFGPPEGLTMEQGMAWLRQHAKGFAAGRKFEREMRGPVAPQDSSALAEMTVRKDGAYEERNRVVALLARLFPSGLARTDIPGWSADWHGCVYIDLPAGQVSWHYHDSQSALFAGLPPYAGSWDGHDTEEKYRRVAACASNVIAALVKSHSQEVTTEINEETLADLICDAEERLGPGCDEQAIAQAILADFDVRAKR